MNNDYILTLPNFLDEDYMKEIGKERVTEEWLSLSDVQALKRFTDTVTIDVESDKYLREVRQRYPKLSSYIKIMKAGKGHWPTHIDKLRESAINIPVQNCDETKVTRFGKNGKKVDSLVTKFGNVEAKWYSHEHSQYVDEVDMDFEFYLQMPTLINTSVPHHVENYTDTIRIILTWAYEDSFEQAKQDILNG